MKNVHKRRRAKTRKVRDDVGKIEEEGERERKDWRRGEGMKSIHERRGRIKVREGRREGKRRRKEEREGGGEGGRRGKRGKDERREGGEGREEREGGEGGRRGDEERDIECSIE